MADNSGIGWGVRVLALGTALGALAACTSGQDPRSSEMQCVDHDFTVDVPAVGADPQRVTAQICQAGEWESNTPVQVLLHGGAYDHRYWDLPFHPDTYSYVRQAVRAGYVTVNIDRLGYGRSSRPDGKVLDFDAGADAVHKVVGQIRAGAVGPGARTVVLNGHSMGGIVAVRAAALGDVDAVIVSGIPPEPDAGQPDDDGPDDDRSRYQFVSAAKDPRFADNPWSAGYLTTGPGTRMEAFHYPGTYDPAIPAVEEQIADTLAIGELRSVRPDPGATDAPAPAESEVPTAYVLGRHDTIACPAGDCTIDPRAATADRIIESSGHSINASSGAADFYRWTFDWLRGRGIG
ncbi:alpha/beta hydrolase [Nocardia sp. NPDC058658]|uniref:alpha/beta hydrolase n=1 Tax=Nocardia sp. NPDC058658 TaxID=3346580 RepID=UPI0036490065